MVLRHLPSHPSSSTGVEPEPALISFVSNILPEFGSEALVPDVAV